MPVNRQHRDALADALAAFLRGELDWETFHTKRDAICAALNEVTDKDPYLDEVLTSELGCFSSHPTCECEWEEMCRHLAFLKTDIQEPTISQPIHEDIETPRLILLARWHTIGLVLALGLSHLLGWWIVAIVWVISFVHFQIELQRHPDPEAEIAALRRAYEFYPFTNKDAWLIHKSSIDEDHIPNFDSGKHGLSHTQERRSETMEVVGKASAYLLFGTLLLFTLPFWPLWLVGMSLRKRERVGPDKDAR